MRELVQIKNPFGGAVWHVKETTSTMDEADALIKENPTGSGVLGSLVMADFQSQGRGRFNDRKWSGVAGQSLLFTIILPPLPRFPLSLVLALGMCRFLEAYGLQPQVKWPNDILLGEAKLCGILVVGTSRLMQCGIGLNLGPQDILPIDTKRRPTSLTEHQITLSPRAALELILTQFSAVLKEPAESQRTALEQRLYKLHQEIEVVPGNTGSTTVRGQVQGLAPDGALLLASPSGVVKVYSGE